MLNFGTYFYWFFSNNVVESCSLKQCTATNIYCAVHCLSEQKRKGLGVHNVGITAFIATIWRAIAWVVALWIWREDLALGFQVVRSLEHMSYKWRFRVVKEKAPERSSGSLQPLEEQIQRWWSQSPTSSW